MATALKRTTLGDFELTICSDGPYFLDAGSMFGVVPKTLWEKRIQANERNQMTCGENSVLVRTGDKNILIETGIGNKLPEKLDRIYDAKHLLLDSLHAAGVAPEEIDIVINSHLHFDHCGWNTMLRDGKVVPTFPNAKYYAQRGEVEHGHLQLERDRISYISENYDPLVASGQMTLLDGNAQIAPGISVELFPGHTAQMQAIVLESQGKKACYISDLIPTTAHLDITWVMAYDLDPLTTIEQRKRFYARAIPEKWLVLFTHDHDTPMAYVEKDEKGKLTAVPV